MTKRFVLQVQNAINAGAQVVILGNNNANGYFRLSKDANAVTPSVPALSVPLSTYLQASTAIQLGVSLTVQIMDTVLSQSKLFPHS